MPLPGLAPAPIEQMLVAFLTTATGHPWATKVPTDRPTVFGRLLRAGGAPSNEIQSKPRLIVEAWGTTDSAAWALSSDAWSALNSAARTTVGGLWIAAVDITEPINYPDTATRTPRYQFIVTPTVHLPRSNP